MNAVAELERNPVSTIFSRSMEMSRLTWDGTDEPVSRDQILRRETNNIIFSCSADHEQDWQPYWSITLATSINNVWPYIPLSVCVFSSHLFWTSGLLDVPAGVTDFFFFFFPPVQQTTSGIGHRCLKKNLNVVVVVFFTLTDRASTIPSNTRGCQSGTWSAGQKKIRGTFTKLQWEQRKTQTHKRQRDRNRNNKITKYTGQRKINERHSIESVKVGNQCAECNNTGTQEEGHAGFLHLHYAVVALRLR